MDVSIIIVNWNTRLLLDRCLRSIEAGVGGLAAQVLVVDNGSTDGSAELVADRFPQVELVRNQENVGFARANNQAYGRAQGRYVLLLNPDTELRVEAVKQMVRFLDADQTASRRDGGVTQSWTERCSGITSDCLDGRTSCGPKRCCGMWLRQSVGARILYAR